jgi:hypothetical protein
MRLGMVYKVRDEADIIEDNLRFHAAQGVDLFVVVDTGSIDGTIEILERYERAGLVRLERTIGGIHDMKRGGEEEITRLAGEMGADWIIHNDADEFWWPAAGTLKDAFEAIPEEFGMVLAPRTEFVVRPGDGPFADRMTVREANFRRPAKSAHRHSDRISLRGPHPVEIWTGDTAYRGLVGKPVLRTQAQHREDDPMELVITPSFPVGVLHFPFRTFEQYRRRVEIARDNGQLERNEDGRAVRKALEEGRLAEVYERLILDDDAVAAGIADGWLVEQTSFRDYLAACPDPLSDGSTGPPTPRADGGGPTAAQLRDDSMYAISRYLQTQAERAGRHRRQGARVREYRQRLKARNRSLRTRTNRLRRVESSLWWRMRPRIPRGVARRLRSLRR